MNDGKGTEERGCQLGAPRGSGGVSGVGQGVVRRSLIVISLARGQRAARIFPQIFSSRFPVALSLSLPPSMSHFASARRTSHCGLAANAPSQASLMSPQPGLEFSTLGQQAGAARGTVGRERPLQLQQLRLTLLRALRRKPAGKSERARERERE